MKNVQNVKLDNDRRQKVSGSSSFLTRRDQASHACVIATVIVLLAYIAVIVMLGCLIGLFAELINTGYERDDFETVVCLVAYGDTAWDYADRYCPEGLDKREYLEWCAKENGLDGIMGDIHYGRSYVFLKLK